MFISYVDLFLIYQKLRKIILVFNILSQYLTHYKKNIKIFKKKDQKDKFIFWDLSCKKH